jgi:hypothetical protein
MMDIEHKSKILRIKCHRCGVESKQILKQEWGIRHQQVKFLCLPIYDFILENYIHYLAIGSSILLFKLQYVIIYFDEWNFVYLGADVMCKEMHIRW